MKTVTCKAAVLYDYKKPLVIEDVTIDPPGRGEVRVKIAATSICHSDIHSFRGEHGTAKLPAIGGHEIAGYIDELGEGVSYDVSPGDHVLVTLPSVGCGQCFYCTIGFPNACEKGRPHAPPGTFKGLAVPGRYVNKKGERLSQLGGRLAGFAEYTVVSENNLVKIPNELPFDRAAPIACGVITAFGAVVNHAQVKPFSSVVVIGAGGVGLNAVQAARLSGAYPIIAVDILDNKLEMAKEFGATYVVNSKKVDDPVKRVWELTSGRGADYVIIAVGGVDLVRQGFMMSGFRGMTVIIGHHGDDTLTGWQPTDFFSRFVTGGGLTNARIRVDIPRLVEYYLAGRLKLDELITAHYPLEGINDAIESMLHGTEVRPVIMF